jgi:hypothetical protein
MQQTLQIDGEVLKTIKAFNRNVEWLRTREVKEQAKKTIWGTYEEAHRILPRSKQWYKIQRLGIMVGQDYAEVPTLEKDKDWRMIGNRVEYRLEAIVALKNKMIS